MVRKKPFVLLLILLVLQLIILLAFGFWVFLHTKSIAITLLAIVALTLVRFCSHIFLFFKCRRLLKRAMSGVSYNRFDEVSIPVKVTWLNGTISLNKKLFGGNTAVTQDSLYIMTMAFLPREIIQLAWDDIAQIRVASPVRAIIYFKTPTEVELTIPWKSSYEAYVPKSVGFQKDEVYRYKN